MDTDFFREVDQAANVLRALAHPLRLGILRYLMDNTCPVQVSEIYTHLRSNPSFTSQHLSILKKERLILVHRKGKEMYYAANGDILLEISRAVLHFEEITWLRKKQLKGSK